MSPDFYCIRCKRKVRTTASGRHVIVEQAREGRIRTRWCRGPLELVTDESRRDKSETGHKTL